MLSLVVSALPSTLRVFAFVQARMTSRRFPGKVLAPFRGRPMIEHVLERVARAVGRDRVVLATSTDASDDPLAAYAAKLSYRVSRGPLDDVFARFEQCLRENPCDWFFRVCADSPLYEPELMLRALALAGDQTDLVTNVFPRSFASGLSVELVRTEAFARLSRGVLTAEQREHATKGFYDAPKSFNIVNFSAEKDSAGGLTVDTLEDLRRLEAA